MAKIKDVSTKLPGMLKDAMPVKYDDATKTKKAMDIFNGLNLEDKLMNASIAKELLNLAAELAKDTE